MRVGRRGSERPRTRESLEVAGEDEPTRSAQPCWGLGKAAASGGHAGVSQGAKAALAEGGVPTTWGPWTDGARPGMLGAQPCAGHVAR